MTLPPTTEMAAPAPAAEPCAACGAPLANDQRYCLHCGEGRPDARRELPPGLLRRERPLEPELERAAALPAWERRPSTATALAGLACLLLAMGVGVLIGRGAGGDGTAAAPITIAGAPIAASGTAASGTAAPAAATFAGDWRGGHGSWTVALETLAKDATQPADVTAAKSAASGKGATAVGALDSDDYATLSGGSYVVYAGQFSTKAAAAKALAPLKASFDRARVVHVATEQAVAPAGASTSTAAPAARSAGAAKDAADTKKAFEQSKKAPTTVAIPGKAPPKDDKPAANGAGFEGDRMSDDLLARRDALAERAAQLQFDLGGLAYEMAIRDHFRLDVLMRRAAALQAIDAELGEIARLLALEQSATAGACPACSALHGHGAVFCWQCGHALVLRIAAPNGTAGAAAAAAEPPSRAT